MSQVQIEVEKLWRFYGLKGRHEGRLKADPVAALKEALAPKSGWPKPALLDVSLDAKPGEILAVLGRNGSGKTTLFRALMALIHPSAGTLRLFGQDPWTMPPETRARIGYLPQDLALLEWMTVEEILRFNASFYPVLEWSFVEELLRRMELMSELNKPISTLSGGTKKKVGLLLAMGHRPELLVLDEPFNDLDVKSRRDFIEEMLSFFQEKGNATILISSHLLTDVERLADRVALFKEGRLRKIAPLDQLKETVKLVVLGGMPETLPPLTEPGLLSQKREGENWLLTFEDCDEEKLQRLKKQFEGASFQSFTLSLEDIFLAYCG